MQLQKYVRGFTLIELLITVAIVGIISSIAYPSYSDFVVRSNRSEGQRELLRLANLQEQFFVDSRAYTTNMKKLGLNADPYVTTTGNYSIDATVDNDTFILTATAKGNQYTKDTSCRELTINEVGSKTPASDCWE